MLLYTEGIIWYLLLADCLIYGLLSWSKGKWHQRATHWLSPHIPLNKPLAAAYVIFVLWLGFALLRLEIILFR